ncbi:MAG: FecR domain-containing protein [Gemmatimonadaceae bacterium]
MSQESGASDLPPLTSEEAALARRVSGESRPDDARLLAEWLHAHPEDAAVVDLVKAHADQAQRSADALLPAVDVEGALRRVRDRMEAPALRVVPGGAPRVPGTTRLVTPQVAAPSRARSRTRWVALAAAAVLVAVVVPRFLQDTTESVAMAAPLVVATAVGQQDTVRLPDGTRIVVAPGSRVTVPADFATGARTVQLDGSAYFEVVHNAARPFMVQTTGAEIRDIGTAFTVTQDAVGGVGVVVTHGTVAVRRVTAQTPVGDAVELHAGDRGAVQPSGVSVQRGVVAAADTAWMGGQLAYRDAALSMVQADLARWYGRTVQVADSALLRLTVTMPPQPDAARAIQTITALLGAVAEQHGDTVVLRSAGARTTP